MRRLAANDSSIDLMSLDVVFVPEFAEAGFLRPFTDDEAAEPDPGRPRRAGRDGHVGRRGRGGALLGQHPAALVPQVGGRAGGHRPADGPVTWDQVIDAAEATDTTVAVTGGPATRATWCGSTPWSCLPVVRCWRIPTPARTPSPSSTPMPAEDRHGDHPPAGHDGRRPGVVHGDRGERPHHLPGRRRRVHGQLALRLQRRQGAVDDGSLDPAVFDDIAWARFPQVEPGTESAPPLGGIDLAIGAFSDHPDEAVDAASCITSVESQTEYMLAEGNPAAGRPCSTTPSSGGVPHGGPHPRLDRHRRPRPRSAYYTDVSAATVREFHPPDSVDPDSTPGNADDLIVNVLQDKQLL